MENIQSPSGSGSAEGAADPADEAASVVGSPAWRRSAVYFTTPGDFDDIRPDHCHGPASTEHNRTIREFLETGQAKEKSKDDFACFPDPDVAWATHLAHRKALQQIENILETERDLLEGAAEAAELAKVSSAPELTVAQPVEVRGQSLAALTPACRYSSKPISPLDISRESSEDYDRTGEGMENVDRKTRALLNDLLGECHFLMKEVAFRSICQSGDVETRMDFLNAAMRLAETGAKVGDSAGRLRNGPVVSQTAHRMTVEKIVTNLDGRGEGVPAP